MWVAIHKCMEAMLEISLYSYLYPKLAKTLSFFLSLKFSLQQNQRRGQNRFCLEASGGRGWHRQSMYTHVSKCKNDKVKGERSMSLFFNKMSGS
jgi:hypothetical protein